MRQPMASTQPSFLVHNKHTVPVSYLFLAAPARFVVVVQSLGCVWLYDPKDCSTPGLPGLHHLPEFAQTHVHWVSDAIQPSHLLLPPSPALCLSRYQDLLQWVGSLHQVAKILELQFQHQFSEYSGLISFRINWFDLLAVQGTLKSLLQHQNSKASILQHLSLLYGPTLTSIHDYWKKHIFDYTDLHQQSDVSAF